MVYMIGNSHWKHCLMIQDIIKDKVVCDVGCCDGKFSFMMSKFAKKVIGIEKEQEFAELARLRGIDVLCQDAKDGLPEADVYYIWGMNKTNNEELFNSVKQGIILIRKNEDSESYPNEKLIGMEIYQI